MAPARHHEPERVYLCESGPHDLMPVRVMVRDGRVVESVAMVREHLKADWDELRAALIESGKTIREV